MRKQLILWIATAWLVSLSPIRAMAQQNLVLLPPGYDTSRKYPVVILLPGLGGTALEFVRYYMGTTATSTKELTVAFHNWLRYTYPTASQLNTEAFILVLPEGRATLDGGFDRVIRNTEKQLFSLLTDLKTRYSIDSSRLVISGFSLGGDLSFALSLRNPGYFCGAMVMSSGCGYRSKGVFDGLKDKKFSFYLTMGKLDRRLGSMKQAKQLLDQKGIKNSMQVFAGLDHFPPPPDEYLKGIGQLLKGM